MFSKKGKEVTIMIKKAFENYTLSDKQKDELFQRIENSAENTVIEKEENAKKRNSFLKYASIAAAIVLVTGVTALIVHLVPGGEPINISTPQSSTSESVGDESGKNESSTDDNSTDDNSTDDNSQSGLNPLHKNPSTLPFYKESSVMDMEPRPYGYEGFVQVKFAEADYSDYRFTVAGNFIRREENLYEARFNLYVSKKDVAEISMPGTLDLEYTYKGPMLTRESLETLSETLISVIPMTQNGITYPLIALTIPDESGFYDSFYYDSFKDQGFKTITSFFVAVDGMGYKLSGLNELSKWYPDFDSGNITIDGNVITDSKGWKIKFDLENKTVFADATIYDEEGQKIKDGLLPFDDSNIVEYDGELLHMSDIPYRKVLLDEKTCGEYTFTLFGRFITYTEEPDHYYGYYGLIVSRNGRVIRNNGMVAVDIGSQGGLSTPKDYNYKDMLKVYTMTQNGIEYPLASVTYNITNEDIMGGYTKSVTRFFTVRNGMQESFTDGSTNYKNLPGDVTVNGLSITDDFNFKKITFDFEDREATVITLSEKDADIKKRPYFKDSHIYTEPYKNVGYNFDVVRFAEKSYNNYDFVVGGKMSHENEETFALTLYMYLYQHGELIDIEQMSSSIFGNFRFQLSDVESFANKVLEVRTVHSQGKEYPLASITCEVDAKQLKSYFGEDFSTITDFYMITDNKLNNVIDAYPDYTHGTAITDGVMTDSRGWVTKFDFEKGCANADMILLSKSNQEIIDSLVPFTDDNIPVFNGATSSEKIPYARVFIDEQKAGKYTFTLLGNFIKSDNYPNNYYGYFDLIVSRDGKAIRDYIGTAITKNDERVIAIPKSYNFNNMLKVYNMTQKGIEFPLAVVTYGNPDIKTGENGDSISSFFTVDNGFGVFFSDNRDYSGLSSDIRTAGLSIIDDKNRKKITFDFLKTKSEVSDMASEKDIDIKKRPLYKDSYIYSEPYTNSLGDSDIVRFAEKYYNKYDFIVGGKMSRNEDGSFNVSLNMYLYKYDKLISVQNAISNGGFDFTVSEADMESFGDTVLDLKEFQYFGTAFPLAIVTAKPHSSILEDEFPSAGFTTISNFFTIRKTTVTVDGTELALFHNGGMNYPDYTKNATFRTSENDSGMTVMVDEKGWEVFFNPETLTAHITVDKAYNVRIGIEGEEYKNKKLILCKYPLNDNPPVAFTTDGNGEACFEILPCGTYIITDEDGNNIIDGKSGEIYIFFDISSNLITLKGKPAEEESVDIPSFPLYKDSKLFGEDKYTTGVSERVRFAEVTYEDYLFIVAGELTRISTDYYTAKPRVYVYKNKELMKDFGELYTGTKDGSVKILVQNAKSFTDDMLSVKMLTQNGKEYPLITLAVKGNGFTNYESVTGLYPMDRDYTIPAFYSITDSGVPGMPYQFTGYEDINLYSPVLDDSIVARNNTITDGKEWTVAFDFEKRTASVIPETVNNISITFKGNSGYGNKNYYLQEYTLTDKEKVTIPFTTDGNGKAHFYELPCLTYNIFDEQGNMIYADPHGDVFRVLESDLEDVWIIH